MDKVELKKILKPLIKESIKEVLMEQGLVNLVKETLYQEHKEVPQQKNKTPLQENLKEKAQLEAAQNRKKMLQELAKAGYANNGFNPFANTAPLPDNASPVNEVKVDPRGPLKDIDPSDPGVDISGLMGGNKAVWSALIKTKGK